MSGAIAMGNQNITGVNEIEFDDGFKLFGGGNNNYLKAKAANTTNGGIIFQDGDSETMGYIYWDGASTANFGFLDATGTWAVRCRENEWVRMHYDNSTKLETKSDGVDITGELQCDTLDVDGASSFTVAGSGNQDVADFNNGTNGGGTRVKVRCVANQGGDPFIFFDSGGTNFVIGKKWYGTSNNIMRLGAGNDMSTVSGITISSGGDVAINNSGAVRAKLDLRQSSDHPAFNIGFPDGSFYRNLGTVGPNDTAGNNSSNGGQYLHIRLRTIWNDASMTMFRLTGFYSYSQYTESYVGMYRYASNSYRYAPYGQLISNQSRATVHSMYNTNADPGYLVIVCDWGTNYVGLMIEHNGAGGSYGSGVQQDLEIIDTKRSSSTSAQW